MTGFKNQNLHKDIEGKFSSCSHIQPVQLPHTLSLLVDVCVCMYIWKIWKKAYMYVYVYAYIYLPKFP